MNPVIGLKIVIYLNVKTLKKLNLQLILILTIIFFSVMDNYE